MLLSKSRNDGKVNFIILPRAAQHRFHNYLKVDESYFNKNSVNCDKLPTFHTDGELTSNQTATINYTLNNIFTLSKKTNEYSSNSTIINMPPGQGKTYLAAGFIQKLGARSLYIAPTKKIRDQSAEVYDSWFPNAKVAVWDDK